MADISSLSGRPTIASRGHDTQVVKQTARGIIADMVRELAMMTMGVHTTGPEEMEFNDRITTALGDYITAKKTAGAGATYLTPYSQTVMTAKQSPLLAGLKVEPKAEEPKHD